MAPLTVTIMESNDMTANAIQGHDSNELRHHNYHHELYEEQMYVHRCPFRHCHQHTQSHEHSIDTPPSSRRKVPKHIKGSSPTVVESSPPSVRWSENLTSRGVHDEDVTENYRNKVISYIVEQLSSTEVMQTRHARERLHKTVAALEQTVYISTSHQKEYLKTLAMKLSTVYQHLKKESTCNNSTHLFLCDNNTILKNNTISPINYQLSNYIDAKLNSTHSHTVKQTEDNNVQSMEYIQSNKIKNNPEVSSLRSPDDDKLVIDYQNTSYEKINYSNESKISNKSREVL